MQRASGSATPKQLIMETSAGRVYADIEQAETTGRQYDAAYLALMPADSGDCIDLAVLKIEKGSLDAALEVWYDVSREDETETFNYYRRDIEVSLRMKNEAR